MYIELYYCKSVFNSYDLFCSFLGTGTQKMLDRRTRSCAADEAAAPERRETEYHIWGCSQQQTSCECSHQNNNKGGGAGDTKEHPATW